MQIRISMDPQQSEKLDPDPHSGDLQAKNGAVEARWTHNGGLIQNGALGGLETSGIIFMSRIRIRIKVRSWIRIRI